MFQRTGRLFIFSFFISFFIGTIHAQELKPPVNADSVALKEELTEVVINVFEQNRRIADQPVSVALLDLKQRQRFSATSLVSAMNSISGVRMEERSPGSYRINIRGSSLRSPFGVRNTKIYYNGVPFTDPGGNTYLNQLSKADLHSLKIIKGPAGSIYGAGTGGVLLIHSENFIENRTKDNSVELGFTGGSYGYHDENMGLQWGTEDSFHGVRYTNLYSDGYRNHTAVHQQTFSYETGFKINENQKLDAFFHYTNLKYQTPGALTADEFQANPKSARPASGIFPSAEESNASVLQKAFLTGINHRYSFSSTFSNTTSFYGSYTDFTNPTFRNYEFRKEPHFGGRTVFKLEKEKGNLIWGGEFQQGFFSQEDYGIVRAQPDTIQTSDKIRELTALAFAQLDIEFHPKWEINMGLSINYNNLYFDRNIPQNEPDFRFKSKPLLIPRVALSRKLNTDHLVFLSWSKGFSPPTLAEILPSTAEINRDLEAERGWQYELGIKGSLAGNNLHYEMSGFLTRMNQSISSRRDASGADYFVNAGGAHQKGIELSLAATIYQHDLSFFRKIETWGSGTLFDFKYSDYQVQDNDFSGKRFPGTAKRDLSAGIDFVSSVGRLYLTYQHTSKIPLNDANTVYSTAYDLIGFQLIIPWRVHPRFAIEFHGGGENLLDKMYSLGNDINAFGGRYFNLAPGANFKAGVKLKYEI